MTVTCTNRDALTARGVVIVLRLRVRRVRRASWWRRVLRGLWG